MHTHRRDWAKKIQEALWAYPTTWTYTTEHTPYELIYERHVLFPIEFQVKNFMTIVKLGLDLSEEQRQRME